MTSPLLKYPKTSSAAITDFYLKEINDLREFAGLDLRYGGGRQGSNLRLITRGDGLCVLSVSNTSAINKFAWIFQALNMP